MIGRELTHDEVMSRSQEALADLLVKLGSSDAGLATLVRALKPAPTLSSLDIKTSAGKDLPAPRDLGKTTDEPFMVGESPAMLRVFDTIRRFAKTSAPVLIQGESGTGKELAAQAIHERSPYADGPFVAINCGGLPASLIASELFGHEKGAFTGAHQRKIGKLEAADGGTLFLDEIGDMPLELQPHLLRFLQEQTIERVGSNKPVQLNCRIIAATNRDLQKQIVNEQFREDLFHRLNCLALTLPPLRERGEDIVLLGAFFAKTFAAEINGNERFLSEAAIAAMRRYHWPGNVRELISKLRRAVVMTDNDHLSVEDLGLVERPDLQSRDDAGALAGAAGAAESIDIGPLTGVGLFGHPQEPCTRHRTTLEEAKARIEETLVRDALGKHSHNITVAARDLGVSRVTLYRLIEKYSIRCENTPSAH
ncbi:sigma-54 interaction domain-containing protein [Pelagibius litoralis]|uniref:sigma-54 interaction domain-containing protein n=1 Tax=Pelagibius litoralis TaxID=374515 RepID=UPI001980E115|nr:sigma-54 dependent transcriptional regulator [Pelagibius litoralis]